MYGVDGFPLRASGIRQARRLRWGRPVGGGHELEQERWRAAPAKLVVSRSPLIAGFLVMLLPFSRRSQETRNHMCRPLAASVHSAVQSSRPPSPS